MSTLNIKAFISSAFVVLFLLGISLAPTFPSASQSLATSVQILTTWSPEPWGECVDDMQTRLVLCRDENGVIVSDHLCIDEKPKTTQWCSNENPKNRFADAYPASWEAMIATFNGKKTFADIPAISPVLAPPFNANKGLKRHLIIGDSISLCYTPYVREYLSDIYEVHRVPHNGASTENALASIDGYLEAGPWDLITVNWGLHDLSSLQRGTQPRTYKTEQGVYKDRLTTLLSKLQSSGAEIVWVRTTPTQNPQLPIVGTDAVRFYHNTDVATYNAISDGVVSALGIRSIDISTSPYRTAPLTFQTDKLHFEAISCSSFGTVIEKEIRSHIQQRTAWVSDGWGVCEGEMQYKTVSCMDASGHVYPDAMCPPEKPTLSRSCVSAEPYTWERGDWTVCKNSLQTRDVSCIGVDGEKYVHGFCSGEPLRSRSCADPLTFSWQSSAWNACARNGTQTRTVQCIGSDGKRYGDARCTTAKPVVSQSCKAPLTYAWQTGTWNACARNGTQTRTVQCIGSDGKRYGDALCKTTKPSTTQSCTSAKANAWSTSNWSACVNGNRTRTLFCKGPDGSNKPQADCSGTQPILSERCTVPSQYSWTTSNWTACTNGARTRTIFCRGTDGANYPQQHCSTQSKPITRESCR